jgi:hypothetical protein
MGSTPPPLPFPFALFVCIPLDCLFCERDKGSMIEKIEERGRGAKEEVLGSIKYFKSLMLVVGAQLGQDNWGWGANQLGSKSVH